MVLALAVVCSLGCYETALRLSPIEDAKVDRGLCGHWNLKNAAGDAKVDLTVYNLDDRTYIAEWRTDKDGSLVMVADLTMVGNAQFAHLRGLDEDGTINKSHLILRVDRDGDRLALRNLNDEFIKSLNIETGEALRQAIENNLDTDALYDKDGFAGERANE